MGRVSYDNDGRRTYIHVNDFMNGIEASREDIIHYGLTVELDPAFANHDASNDQSSHIKS